MNTDFLPRAVVIAAAAIAFAGCTPSKEDKPPQPKVSAATPAPAKSTPAMASMTGATSGVRLPKLGAAPAWRLQDLAGKPVSSDQFKGKVVVVDFWATWCPPCRAEIPGYTELQEKYGKDGLVIIGVSLDQAGPDVVKSFAEKNRINYPLVMGDEAIVGAFGGIEGIPTTFLIDRSGQIRDRKVGAEEKEVYEQRIAAVLHEAS